PTRRSSDLGGGAGRPSLGGGQWPTGGGRDLRALRLSFFHAEQTNKRAYYLAAAIYAYAFLFPEDEAADPDSFDPRLRLAADLYNRGITGALASENRAYVDLRSGVFALPFGELHVSFDRDDLIWHGRELTKFVPWPSWTSSG